MNIAFFSEASIEGKTQRNFKQMRTEWSWYAALKSTHHCITKIPELDDNKYDLGIVIIPKKHIAELVKFPLIEQMKRICKKVGVMQEGPSWYFQDYTMEQQVWYFNFLMSCDLVLAHNNIDRSYFKGLTKKNNVYINPTLMITDEIKPTTKSEDRRGVIIGGNMVRWYGGFDSFMVAQEFGESIYAPSMGRKIENEDKIGINHLPYMTWVEWMNNLSKFKYAVHLMPTQAAGTFALNCAYHGIPCIGYKGLDTQEICHPQLSVKINDLSNARRLAEKLKNDTDFYETQSKICKEKYKNNFGEEQFLSRWKTIEDDLNEK